VRLDGPLTQIPGSAPAYSIMSVQHRSDLSFLAVSPQVTLVINPVVGCCYFPPGPRLLSQPKRSAHIGRYQIILFVDRGTQAQV